MSFRTYSLSLTMAKILKPEEKLIATNKPLGCSAIDKGYSPKV